MSFSAIQQRDSVIIYIHSFSLIIPYHVLSQEIGHTSLCCIVGPHCPYHLCNSLHLLIPNSQSIPLPPPSSCLFIYLYFMATPMAYGNSWARDWIWTTAATYTRSFNPLLRTGDRTDTSAVNWAAAVGFLTHCATVGNPPSSCFLKSHIHSIRLWISYNPGL